MTTTTLVPADLIDDALADIGLTAEDVEVLPDYSGRGMFGRTCFAVVCDSLRDFSSLLVAVTEASETLGRDLADRVEWDSMGMRQVYYFPGLFLNGDSAYA